MPVLMLMTQLLPGSLSFLQPSATYPRFLLLRVTHFRSSPPPRSFHPFELLPSILTTAHSTPFTLNVVRFGVAGVSIASGIMTCYT